MVTKVTPKGDDDQVQVIRKWWGVPKVKKCRITVNQIREVIYEPEPPVE